jgi:hypothetical protein
MQEKIEHDKIKEGTRVLKQIIEDQEYVLYIYIYIYIYIYDLNIATD